jgi:hypothetical protein
MLVDVGKYLKPLSPDYFGAFLQSGVQLYHIIEWVLNQSGKGKITVLTFSISEEFIRKIWQLKEANKIESCALVLDFKAMQKTRKIEAFSSKVFDSIHFSKTHAKVVLIETELYHITITGSQNATRGNRAESTMVTTDHTIFETYKQQIDELRRKM